VNLVRLASVRLLASGLAAVSALSVAAPLHANSCIRSYAECLVKAADLEFWWERSAAGIDCYLEAVACVRRAYV